MPVCGWRVISSQLRELNEIQFMNWIKSLLKIMEVYFGYNPEWRWEWMALRLCLPVSLCYHLYGSGYLVLIFLWLHNLLFTVMWIIICNSQFLVGTNVVGRAIIGTLNKKEMNHVFKAAPVLLPCVWFASRCSHVSLYFLDASTFFLRVDMIHNINDKNKFVCISSNSCPFRATHVHFVLLMLNANCAC